MHVLLVIMKYDYGIKERGLSNGHYNWVLCLEKMGVNVTLFDYMGKIQKNGRDRMNEELLQLVIDQKPDLVLVSLFTDQFIPEIMDEIKKYTVTVYYAFDDMWRTEYTDFWAPHFTCVTTSYVKGVKNLRARGHKNGIYLSFGCNHYAYVKKMLPNKYDVSFIGLEHPHRRWLIDRIEKSGVKVHTWGAGWENGPIEFNSMINVINQSKINLNLQNETSWDLRYLLSTPRALKNTLRCKKTFAPVNFRIFEINSCGGFQLLPYMEGLEKRYDIGNELELFHSPEQLVERVHYYLEHEDEREIIAQRGYERTLKEHTMEQRFKDLFKAVGLEAN